MKKRIIAAAFALVLLFASIMLVLPRTAFAKALDEIENYTITVNVNDDATLTMLYHIEWKVLDSDSEGPLEWVKIGIPNSHYISMKGMSSTVKKISYMSSGGSYARVDLDRKYYKDEVASFDFELIQDYMYAMNHLTEGETVFEFTPGWFTDIDVDQLVIRWNADKAASFTPACLVDDGYYTWTTALRSGEKYTVTVTYPNEAFQFDETKSFVNNGGNNGGSDSSSSCVSGLFGFIVFSGICYGVFAFIRTIKNAVFSSTANFSGGTAKKKITREKIVYYPTCQGCGAPRPEG